MNLDICKKCNQWNKDDILKFSINYRVLDDNTKIDIYKENSFFRHLQIIVKGNNQLNMFLKKFAHNEHNYDKYNNKLKKLLQDKEVIACSKFSKLGLFGLEKEEECPYKLEHLMDILYKNK